MQIWAEPEKSALPIRNYSQILYQFLAFTQNLKRSQLTPDEKQYFYHMIVSYIQLKEENARAQKTEP